MRLHPSEESHGSFAKMVQFFLPLLATARDVLWWIAEVFDPEPQLRRDAPSREVVLDVVAETMPRGDLTDLFWRWTCCPNLRYFDRCTNLSAANFTHNQIGCMANELTFLHYAGPSLMENPEPPTQPKKCVEVV